MNRVSLYRNADSAHSLSRREACALGCVALVFAGLGIAAPAWADGASDVAKPADAASGRPASTDAASTGEVAEHVAVPEGDDDVPTEAAEVAFPVTLTDDAGREVTVSSLERVVVCMGSFAKTWQLAGGSLVGATADALADYELEGAENIASVGDFTAPNLEQILALDPTLVIMSAASAGRGGQSSQTDLVEPLESAGVPVLTFKVTLFGDYLRMLRACCDLTGRYDLYHENGLATRDRIDEVLAAVAQARSESGEEAPTCLIMTTYSGGTRVQASSTQTGTMLAELGASNITDADKSLLSDYSLESLVKADPDFIFLLPMGDSSEAAQKALKDQTTANPAWKELTAVKEGRVITLNPKLFLYKPNDDWDDAYEELYEALYETPREQK